MSASVPDDHAGRVPRSGGQLELHSGAYVATVATIGATLRTLQHDGRDLVVPFAADEVRPAWRGATLAPWPNRIVDGRWERDGITHALPLTEPERGHALHGLVAWLDFEPVERTDARVVLAATIQPQPGYPFRVEVRSTFELDRHGLRQRVEARNLDTVDAPFGTGPHPYLVAGPGPVDEWELLLPASHVLETDERLAPLGLVDVEVDPERFDFREPRPIGAAVLDHTFTGIERDATGHARVEVRGDDGAGVAVVFDRACAWVQLYSSDLPGTAMHRAGLAVEPMTCPPDAFNSGTDLAEIPPGGTFTAGWRIAALPPFA